MFVAAYVYVCVSLCLYALTLTLSETVLNQVLDELGLTLEGDLAAPPIGAFVSVQLRSSYRHTSTSHA